MAKKRSECGWEMCRDWLTERKWRVAYNPKGYVSGYACPITISYTIGNGLGHFGPFAGVWKLGDWHDAVETAAQRMGIPVPWASPDAPPTESEEQWSEKVGGMDQQHCRKLAAIYLKGQVDVTWFCEGWHGLWRIDTDLDTTHITNPPSCNDLDEGPQDAVQAALIALARHLERYNEDTNRVLLRPMPASPPAKGEGEARSANHRYLDLQYQLDDAMKELEQLREMRDWRCEGDTPTMPCSACYASDCVKRAADYSPSSSYRVVSSPEPDAPPAMPPVKGEEAERYAPLIRCSNCGRQWETLERCPDCIDATEPDAPPSEPPPTESDAESAEGGEGLSHTWRCTSCGVALWYQAKRFWPKQCPACGAEEECQHTQVRRCSGTFPPGYYCADCGAYRWSHAQPWQQLMEVPGADGEEEEWQCPVCGNGRIRLATFGRDTAVAVCDNCSARSSLRPGANHPLPPDPPPEASGAQGEAESADGEGV